MPTLSQNETTILSYLCGATMRRETAQVLRAKLVPRPPQHRPIHHEPRGTGRLSHPKRRWIVAPSPVAEPALRVWVAPEVPAPRPGRPATFKALRASLV